MTTKLIELQNKLHMVKQAGYHKSMSDNWYHTNGGAADTDRLVRKLEQQIEAEQERLDDVNT